MGLAYGLVLECEGKWNRDSPSCETWCISHLWLNFFKRKKEKERKGRERKGKKRKKKKREGKRKGRGSKGEGMEGRKDGWKDRRKDNNWICPCEMIHSMGNSF